MEKIKEVKQWLAYWRSKVPLLLMLPVVLSHEITSKGADVDRLATPILNRPKPKPKPVEQPKQAEQPQPQQPAQEHPNNLHLKHLKVDQNQWMLIKLLFN